MLEWTDHLGNHRTGKIPSNIQRLVDLIGLSATVDLMLAVGGSSISFPRSNPKPDNRVLQAIGMDATRVLIAEYWGGSQRIPVNGRFLARNLRGRGLSVQEIARQLRRADKTIRIYLKADET